MSDRAHAGQARECLDRIEVDDLELASLQADESTRASAAVPDLWDEETWDETLEDARETAGLDGSNGTLTTKPINGHDYYSLQWREGDSVKSQYVAPVDPS